MVGVRRPRPENAWGRADEAAFSPVRSGNAFEETVERLLGVIRLGRVTPGERLPPQRELAQRLHVSRVTLREALRSLEEAGYVETSRGRRGGTVVLYESATRALENDGAGSGHGSMSALGDALAFRLALEPAAAALAASQPRSREEIARLESGLKEAGAAASDRYRHADSNLHLAIAELSRSPSLVEAIAGVRLRVNGLLDAMPLLPHNLDHSSRQHEQIVRAVLNGNAQLARLAMEEHLSATGALLRGFLG